MLIEALATARLRPPREPGQGSGRFRGAERTGPASVWAVPGGGPLAPAPSRGWPSVRHAGPYARCESRERPPLPALARALPGRPPSLLARVIVLFFSLQVCAARAAFGYTRLRSPLSSLAAER